MEDEFQYNNEEESEMGQLHAIHLSLNAIAAAQRKLKTGPSLEFCTDCGDEIPQARRNAVAGCDTCIYCQAIRERK